MVAETRANDAQQAIADALAQFCADRCDADAVKALAGKFPDEVWKGVAELGVLALATPEGDCGAMALVAALESLGWGDCHVIGHSLGAAIAAAYSAGAPERVASNLVPGIKHLPIRYRLN